MVCCMYLLESAHRGDSNEQQNIHFMIKYDNVPKVSIDICFLGLSREFPRDLKRISHGKRVIEILTCMYR